ncbi:hypothetical protein AHF37_00904 [Paragonimus kellicotti]|nr:hypothetical protein AHF37_00904 [Paragonimus kellicotti]
MPKSGKGGKAKTARVSIINSDWNENIRSFKLFDDTWRPSVSFVAASNISEKEVIQILEAAIAAGERQFFSVISFENSISQIHQFGNLKGKKNKDTPLNYEICEEARSYLDLGTPVPSSIFAKVLKFFMMNIRVQDEKLRELMRKAQEASEGKEKPRKGAADAKSKVSKGQPTTKTAGKNPGTQQPEPPSIKGCSKLLKRGEEVLEEKFIGDEPDNGVSHYIILLGFEDPDLLGALCEIDVQVDSIIRLKVTDAGRFQELLLKQKAEKVWGSKGAGQTIEEMREEQEKIEAEEKKLNHYWHKVNVILRDNPYGPLGNVATLDYRVKSELLPQDFSGTDNRVSSGQTIEEMREEQEKIEAEEKKLNHYWHKVNVILRDNPYGPLGNVATLDYRVKSELLPQDFSGTDNRLSFGMKMFDELAAMLYDLMDFRRQWENYLKHIKVIPLPSIQDVLLRNPEEKASPGVELTKTPENEEATDGVVDMRIYEEVLQGLPVENTSVELVLHAILEQVNSIATGTLSNSALEDANIESDGMVVSTAKALAKSVEQLILTEEERSLLSKELPLPVKPLQSVRNNSPLLLHPYDLAGYRQHFGCGQVTHPENLYEAELRLIKTCYPSLKETRSHLRNKDQDVDTNPTSSLQNETKKENRKKSRFQQLLYFADKTGLDPDGGILRRPQSSDSRTSQHTSRSQSAVHFELPETENPAAGSDSDRNDVTDTSSEVNKRELWEILERIQQKNALLAKQQSNGVDGVAKDDVHVNFSRITMAQRFFGQLVQDRIRQRFDEWCIEEPMKMDVMLQRLNSSRYEFPCVEVFQRHRDGSRLIFAHHPFDRNLRSNHYSWSQWIHVADIGFRAYLQHVEGHIAPWTKEQEAIYQAQRLSSEIDGQLERDMNAEQSNNKVDFKDKKGSKELRGKTKGRISSTEARSRDDSYDSLIGDSEKFIIPGSLKSIKKEQERKQHEKETTERELEQRRVRSAARVAEKGVTQKEIRTSSKTSRRGSPTTPNAEGLSASNESLIQLQQPTSSEFLPFTGYDFKNVLPHWTGETTNLFPTDGATVKTQRSQLPNGESILRISLLKDGHVFTMHNVEGPVDPGAGCSDNLEEEVKNEVQNEDVMVSMNEELSPRVNAGNDVNIDGSLKVNPLEESTDVRADYFSSLTAVFNDGLNLTISPAKQAYKSPWKLFNTEFSPATNKANEVSDVCSQVTEGSPDVNDALSHANCSSDVIGRSDFGQNLYLTLPDGVQISFTRTAKCCSLQTQHLETVTQSDEAHEQLESGVNETTENDQTSKNYLKNSQSSHKNREDIESNSLMNLVKMTRPIGIAWHTDEKPKETEIKRYLTSEGVVLIVCKVKDDSQFGIKLLFPDGNRMECHTSDWSKLRAIEQPKFLSDVEPPRSVLPKERQISQLMMDPKAETGKTSGAAHGVGKKSATSAKMDRKKLDDRRQPGVEPLKLRVTDSSSGCSASQSEYKKPDVVDPWLVTLASGERYWLKTPNTLGKSVKTHFKNDSRATSSASSLECEKLVVSVEDIIDPKHTSEFETVTSSSLEVYRSFDPATGQTLLTRPEDGLTIVQASELSPPGLIVQHPDGTRQTQILSNPNRFPSFLGSDKRGDNRDAIHADAVDEVGAQELHLLIRTECPGFPALLLNTTTNELETSLFGCASTASKLYTSAQGQHLLLDTEELTNRIPNQSPHQNQNDCATSPDQVIIETSTSSSSSSQKHKSENYPTELFEYDEHVPLVFIQNPGTQEAVEWTRFRDACKLFVNARQVETVPTEWSLYQLGSEQTIVTGHLTVKHEQTAPRGHCGEMSHKGTDQDTGAIFVQESHPNNSDVYSLTLMEPIVSYEPRPAYVQQCIIPKGLTCRDWQPNGRNAISQTFPPPKLGEKAGRGLDIIYPELDYLGSKKPLDLGVPLMSTHRAAVKHESGKNTQPHLLIRRLVQYQPLTDEKRTKIFDILRAYSEHILNRAIEWCLCQPIRSPRAKRNPTSGMSASIFDASVLSKETNRVILNNTESVDEVGAEKLLCATPAPESVLSSSEASHIGLDFGQTSGVTMTPAQKAAYDAMRRELEKAKRNKAVLRDRSVPNYFRFVQGLKFLLKQGPNPTNVTNELTTNQALDANNDLKDNSKDKSMRTGSIQSICKPISPPFMIAPSESTDAQVDDTGANRTAKRNVPLSYNDLTRKQEISQKYVYYRPSNQTEGKLVCATFCMDVTIVKPNVGLT